MRRRWSHRWALALVLTAGVVAALTAATGYPDNRTLSGPYLFALLGNDGAHLQEERGAGVEAKVFSLSWRMFYPSEGVKDRAYLERKKIELQDLRAAGFRVILSLGYHDTPLWVHEDYADSHYVNQYSGVWTGDTFTSSGAPFDNGDANLVFNHELRGQVSSYMKDAFSEFGTEFYAVRVGGGRYGELTYPLANWNGETNLYWAYDRNAQAASPVPGWRPGDPSPNGEAKRFLNWYLDSLVDYQNWQIEALRQAGYLGRAMVLYPSWGIRPGDLEAALASDLDGSTSAEKNGEVRRGYDFARQVGSISDPKAVATTTWLDASVGPFAEKMEDKRYWSPVHYLSYLADSHPLSLETYGENTGQGSRAEMEYSAQQMRRWGLSGMAWYNESEMLSGSYATLRDYAGVIGLSDRKGRETIAPEKTAEASRSMVYPYAGLVSSSRDSLPALMKGPQELFTVRPVALHALSGVCEGGSRSPFCPPLGRELRTGVCHHAARRKAMTPERKPRPSAGYRGVAPSGQPPSRVAGYWQVRNLEENSGIAR